MAREVALATTQVGVDLRLHPMRMVSPASPPTSVCVRAVGEAQLDPLLAARSVLAAQEASPAVVEEVEVARPAQLAQGALVVAAL